MAKAIILTDGKAGHENQSRALARALGCEFEIVEVHFKSKFHKALSYLLDRLGVRTMGLFDFSEGTAHFTEMRPPDAEMRPPDAHAPNASGRSSANCAVVLGTGSGTFYAAKAMAQKLGAKCGVVLYPRGYDLASFDAILAPAFDRPRVAPNVIAIPANLVAADPAFYEKGVAAFREHYAKTTGRELPVALNSQPSTPGTTPSITAVIVGGPNKCSTMSGEWMKDKLDEIFSDSQPSSSNLRPLLWVTTSRRTPPEVEALVDSYPWDYKLIYSHDRFNPIPAFVSLAKKLYVTAESTGMLSEACTFGSAEVHPLDNLRPGPHKFRRFMEGLVAAGCARGVKLDLAPLFARVRTRLCLPKEIHGPMGAPEADGMDSVLV